MAAADAMRTRGMAPRLLIGHSLGGAAVLAAAASIPEARAVATIGAPFDPGHVLHLLTTQLPEIEARGEAVGRSAAVPSPSSGSSSMTCGRMIPPRRSTIWARRCW